MGYMTEQDIPDLNVFMMCHQLDPAALRQLPDGYHIRPCRPDELTLWKQFPFDTPDEAREYQGFMTEFFDRVYADRSRLFFEKCLFVCDSNDTPVATAFIWQVYGEFNTVHWLKVLKSHEGRGLGRALMSHLMLALNPEDFPVYLHTQPGSFRAIKLYSDFGFHLLTDPVIGNRNNDLQDCLPILEEFMPTADFSKLQTTTAPAHFLQTVARFSDEQF